MKIIIKTIISLILLNTVFYLLFAFVKADINPFNWNEEARFFLAYIILITIILSPFVVRLMLL